MSGTDTAELIQIRATAKRNGITSLLIGVVGLLLAMGLFTILPSDFVIVGIFAVSAALVAMLIGWFKIREPVHSVELSREKMTYHHRRGHWHVTWDNIQRIDTPRVSEGLDQIALGMVGIKLKEYKPLLMSISPRLATNLLLEQRALLLQSANCNTGTCYSANLLEDDKHRLPDGTILRGVQAMLANRMKKLRENLGFDLYIAVSELDREPDEFVTLLRQCQQQVVARPAD